MNLSRQGFSTFVIGSANYFVGTFFSVSDDEDELEDDEDEELDEDYLPNFYLLLHNSYSDNYFIFNPQFFL